jgi:hypothetical protein
MLNLEFSSLTWSLLAIQTAGIASAWLTRLAEGSKLQSGSQAFFFLCLATLGVATAGSLTIGPGTCMSCGATLSVMAVAATCDFTNASRHGEFF